MTSFQAIDQDQLIMQTDWDERAKKNALHYICSEKRDWDLDAFFASGENDYDRLVAPFLNRLGFAASGKSMLEVGCGVGRVTRSFAHRFASVTALDISAEMLRRGEHLNASVGNIVWLQGDGQSFADVQSSSVDFVFSYLVLQHVPSEELALGYVREMMRVLKPGGAYRFQFNSCPNPTMNWKGRLFWNVVDRSVGANPDSFIRKGARQMAAAVGMDGFAAGKTWRGAVLPPQDVLEAIWESGGVVHGVQDWGTPQTWCQGTKSEWK